MATLDSTEIDARADYNLFLKLLHWLMAASFLFMFGSAIVMEYLEISRALQFQLYQLHKSAGVLLLIAVAVRLGVRWAFPLPREIDGLSDIERRAARTVHIALYGFMISIPLTGWLMVSASGFGLPTIVFGWFEWPHIPGLQGVGTAEAFARFAHTFLAWSFGAALVLHIAAALKHQFLDKQDILSRIVPGKGAA